jgi:hypothetical protein
VTITCQQNTYHTDWLLVISDAEEEINAMKSRIAALRASIKIFRERMEAGEPLPEGLEKKQVGTEAGSIPA